LEAHDHIYEPFEPQTVDGISEPAHGIRSFIIGTGRDELTEIVNIAPNNDVRNASTFGVLMLRLHPNSYDWQFVAEAGKNFTDGGTGFCH